MGFENIPEVLGVIVFVSSFSTIDAHELSAYSLLKLKSNYGIQKGYGSEEKFIIYFQLKINISTII